MRRIAAVMLGVACLLALAAPAGAADRYQSSVINVYWHYQQPLAPNVYRQTTWYVGAYEGPDGIWSDLYQDVSVCAKLGPRIRCRLESYRVGYSNLDRPGEYYTIDRQGLTEADLRGLYMLESYDKFGNRRGSAEPAVIVTHAEGVGELNPSQELHVYHSGCQYYVTASKGASRGLEATGTLNGQDLGKTYDGFMSNDATLTHYQGC